MDLEEKNVILILADISGYTEFMLSNDKTRTHSQLVISELVKAILEQIELPLQVAKLEGDAIFLYAVKDESDAAWKEYRPGLGKKLIQFFQVFSDKVAQLTIASICRCTACTNIERLKLKIIAHSGKAVFYELGGFVELSGVDVIVAHRLLKNSVLS